MSQMGQFTINGMTEVKTLTGDVGGPVAAHLSNIDLLGSANIQTVGDPLTNKINFSIVGTTDHCVQVGNLLGSITSLPAATNGQILVGSLGGDPAWYNLAVSNGIAKVEGAGTLAISGINADEAVYGVVRLATNAEAIAGIATVPTTNAAIVPTSLKAKLGAQTLHGLPIGAADTAAIAWTAEPSHGQLLIGETGAAPSLATLTAAANIGIANAAHSITIKVAGTTDHAVQIGNANGDLTSLAIGTNGQVIIGATAASPVWGALGVNSGLTAHGVLIGEGNAAIEALAEAATGTVLAGVTGANPAFSATPTLTTVTATTLRTGDPAVAAEILSLTGKTITCDGTNAAVGLTVTPKGAGNVVITTGDLSTTAGALSAGTTVTGGTGVTATTGNITATAGNFIATAGSATLGNIAADVTASDLTYKKNRAGAALTTGDALGQIHFSGYEGASYIDGAKITSTSSGVIGANLVGGNLQFYTHPNSAAANPTLRMTIQPTGEILIAAPDSGTGLTVTAGGITATAGNIAASAGTVSASTTVTAGTDLISTAGNVKLPTTTAVVGQIMSNNATWAHSYSNGGSTNVFIGSGAGNFTLTTGISNVGIGTDTLKVVSTGNYNEALGYKAGTAVTTGTGNFLVGYQSGWAIADGSYNTAIGTHALESNVSTDGNIAIGYRALEDTVTAGSIGLGYYALQRLNGAGAYCIGIGYEALKGAADTTSIGTIAIGKGAAKALTLASGTIAIGQDALLVATTPTNTIAIGFEAGKTISTATDNTLIGYGVGAAMTTGGTHTAIGSGALATISTSSTGCVAIGYLAANACSSGGHVAIGSGAMRYTGAGATHTTAVGYQACQGDGVTAPTGDKNVALGYATLKNYTSGSYNTALGSTCLKGITSGSNNVGIGNITSTTGGGSALTGNDHSNIMIMNVGVAGDVHTMRLGTDGTGAGGIDTVYVAGINTSCGATTNLCLNTAVSNGGYKIGLSSSSLKLKENIKDLGDASNFIYKLRPVEFSWKSDPLKKRECGLIAEEVAEISPMLVLMDKNGEPMTVRYELLSSLLLNELQKLTKRHEVAIDAIQMLADRVKDLERRGNGY